MLASKPQDVTACVTCSFVSWLLNAVIRLLTSVLRRRANAAYTTRKKNFSSSTSTGGSLRTTARSTADVTFGCGSKHSRGTAKRYSGSV